MINRDMKNYRAPRDYYSTLVPIAFFIAVLMLVEWIDRDGWQRICNDEHIQCEDKS